MRKAYPSDISREQFEYIKEDLESNRKKTRPRKTDLYEVLCAIFYLLKEGCQWRGIPKDFPKWRIVYFYFQQWSEEDRDGNSLLSSIQKKINAENSRKPSKE